MNRIALLILTLFVSVGAVAGGMGLIGGGVEPDLSLLNGTPFSSYVVPGWILLLAVGGTNLVAGILLLIDHEQASSFAFLAGAVLTTWIAVQVVMIGMVSILQPAFFVLGLMTMAFGYRYWLALALTEHRQ